MLNQNLSHRSKIKIDMFVLPCFLTFEDKVSTFVLPKYNSIILLQNFIHYLAIEQLNNTSTKQCSITIFIYLGVRRARESRVTNWVGSRRVHLPLPTVLSDRSLTSRGFPWRQQEGGRPLPRPTSTFLPPRAPTGAGAFGNGDPGNARRVPANWIALFWCIFCFLNSICFYFLNIL